MKRKFTRFMSVTLASIMVLTLGSSTLAVFDDNTSSFSNGSDLVVNDISDKEIDPIYLSDVDQISEAKIENYDKYVFLDKDSGEFKISEDKIFELSEKEFIELNSILQKTNNSIEIGKELSVYSYSEENSIVLTDNNPRVRAHGFTGVRWHWWGVRVYISKTHLRNIGKGLAVGGIWIPEAVASKMVATLGFAASNSPHGISFCITPVTAMAPWITFWGLRFQ